jgi:hypothetical protein
MAREPALAMAGEQRCLETTQKLLRFELQRGSPSEDLILNELQFGSPR